MRAWSWHGGPNLIQLMHVMKFSKSRVWDKISEGCNLILEIPKFAYN